MQRDGTAFRHLFYGVFNVSKVIKQNNVRAYIIIIHIYKIRQNDIKCYYYESDEIWMDSKLALSCGDKRAVNSTAFPIVIRGQRLITATHKSSQ